MFAGTVTKDREDGTFDLLYDDGSKEEAVPRPRISPEAPPQWAAVYRGAACHYEVIGLVPDKILAREPGMEVSVEVCVQTIGTEYTWNAADEAIVRCEEESLQSTFVRMGTRFLENTDGGGRIVKGLKQAIMLDDEVAILFDGGQTHEGRGRAEYFV